MIQKSSYLIPCDKSGVQLVRVFHLYGGFKRKIAIMGNFTKISVQSIKLNAIIMKKTKAKCLFVRAINNIFKEDGSFIKFNYNNGVLLKKRTTSFGKRMYGPILKKLKRKKLISSFSKIL